VNIDRPFLEMTDEDWTTVLGTILTGTFMCSQEFARRYRGDEGNIINIGAVTAIRGRKNGANFCSARAGILTLTKCLALELSPKIRVNCVTPGYINTDEVMERYQLKEKENLERALSGIPMRRLGKPEDVFQVVDFIVNTASYVTGQNYFVDGGSYMH
jgi:3-oxoacyl-[acyl-carrier protein] reductase